MRVMSYYIVVQGSCGSLKVLEFFSQIFKVLESVSEGP